MKRSLNFNGAAPTDNSSSKEGSTIPSTSGMLLPSFYTIPDNLCIIFLRIKVILSNIKQIINNM